jgi:hypothetical protein
MRYRVYVSIFLSLILIGMAFWTRFSNIEKKKISLEEVKRAEDLQNSFDDLVEDYLNTPTTTPAGPVELTSTDLIGRQLLGDYVSLAVNGRANDSSILSLADQYVENIPTLIVPNTISYSDVKVAANNKDNLAKYSLELIRVQREYNSQYSSLNPNMVGEGSNLAKQYANFAFSAAQVYRDTATKLKNLSVPPVLAQNHYQLVNIYLSNAAAMEAVAKISSDPATAFAGIVLLGESVLKEQELLSKIGEVLISNGV